jgi:hypothetical protein
MKERGYEASALFREVGLNDISTVEASRYQPYGKHPSLVKMPVVGSVGLESSLLTRPEKTTSDTAVSYFPGIRGSKRQILTI